MGVIKKAAVPVPSVGADGEQPLVKNNKEIIANNTTQNNLQAAESLASEMIATGEQSQNDVNVRQNDLEIISMDELYDTIYPPKIPIVDGLLYNGMYLFVGAPKVGKSFFMARLGYHISKGAPFWGTPVEKGAVLYLALEDDYARLQKRLSRMFGVESTDNFFFATKSKTLNEGLEEQLNQFVKEHQDARLIIIDTLQKVREVAGDKFGYGSDYDIVTKLKRFSDTHNICLLAVHHTRKMESSDSFDMISGTNGLLGAADGAFVMQKQKRTENKAILEMAGRDQQDQRLELNFNRELCVWELVKTETELWKTPIDPVVEAIATMVTAKQPEWTGTATELLQVLENLDVKEKLQPNTLSRKLNICAESLLLDKKIKYFRGRDSQNRHLTLVYQEQE